MERIILRNIAQYFDVYDLLHYFSYVCSAWRSIAEDEETWCYLYYHTKFFTPIKNVKQPKEQFKKQYNICLNMQKGICTKKTTQNRENGEVLYVFDKYYFVGLAGFRIYDYTDNRCLGGSRPDMIRTQVSQNSYSTTIPIKCMRLRCDGKYIIAQEHFRDSDKHVLSVWNFIDVLNGNEEPIRSWYAPWLQDVGDVQFR
eukprot:Phypoly_transcript_20735.p1 GENE.Phypoly_transcript_20735~~Phypoly_transcript_20735.p1  ORF type:complete len:199 (+),score=13.84 Phypoly_transcript_20735:50-646(+)